MSTSTPAFFQRGFLLALSAFALAIFWMFWEPKYYYDFDGMLYQPGDVARALRAGEASDKRLESPNESFPAHQIYHQQLLTTDEQVAGGVSAYVTSSRSKRNRVYQALVFIEYEHGPYTIPADMLEAGEESFARSEPTGITYIFYRCNVIVQIALSMEPIHIAQYAQNVDNRLAPLIC